MSLTPPSQDPPSPSPASLKQYEQAKYAAAAVGVVALPLIAILPPRKLDLYTLGLIGGTAFSANHLVRESTGVSIWRTITGERKPAGWRSGREVAQTQTSQSFDPASTSASAIAELQKQNRAPGGLAPQREAWKLQREKEIKDDVEEGKGFGDMIIDQIWEVWNWGKTGDEEDES